jgi:hypothetical protein
MNLSASGALVARAGEGAARRTALVFQTPLGAVGAGPKSRIEEAAYSLGQRPQQRVPPPRSSSELSGLSRKSRRAWSY